MFVRLTISEFISVILISKPLIFGWSMLEEYMYPPPPPITRPTTSRVIVVIEIDFCIDIINNSAVPIKIGRYIIAVLRDNGLKKELEFHRIQL